ncbi:DUF4236 domain-containing protein [Aliidiomarina sanyensis]|uniref:DUF4236 domain-containing protein n=1 Tax=Aliidiomarina sanyensis TaxID=1249555 RepID=A0A432WKB5_9GAMM|nr:DUF4236 domain-containing protein [Aliidiomarina sanyensis]RUO34272.1 hypothetical protein CWE11_05970 [Aliidiomarina sanyensis]
MAFRFQRRVRIAPGVRLNFSKSGMSVSAGVRGASLTAGKRGIWGNTGIPGTGLSYRSRLDKSPAHQRRLAREQARHVQQSSTRITVQLSCDERGQLIMRDSEGNPIEKSLERQMWATHGPTIDAFLQQELERINDGQELLLNIHLDTPTLNTPAPEFETIPYGEPPPRPPSLPMLPAAYVPPKRWFWHHWFEGLEARRQAREYEGRAAWERDVFATETERNRLTESYEKALAQWQFEKSAHDTQQQKFAADFAARRDQDSEFMSELLEHEIARLDWPRETLVDFDIQQGEQTCVLLDVDLPTAESFPSQEADLGKTGKRLVIKDKSAMQQRKDYMRHVHGVVLRLLGVVFVTLPAVQEVRLSAYTQRLNEATGHEEDQYLLSVSVTREAWATLNLEYMERICPVAALEQFNLVRDMTKTGIFRPIQL